MIPINSSHYVTPAGFQSLKKELSELLKNERPKIVETVRWAAGNGDRSENGDYIYGKKRLREIDRRVRYLTKRIENAVVVDPQLQTSHTKVFFGATVLFEECETTQRVVKIVGLDEADPSLKKISYISPLARALLKKSIGDIFEFKLPENYKEIEIIDVQYVLTDP